MAAILPHHTIGYINHYNKPDSKYKKFQFVKYNDKILILNNNTYHHSLREHVWDVWELKGNIITGYYPPIFEERIEGVIDTFIYANCDALVSHADNYLEFIEYYNKLKISHFLNNL